MTTIWLPEDVAKDEGLRLKAYPDPSSSLARELRKPLADRCAGWRTLSGDPWTCGYGTTGPDICPTTIFTQAQAYARLLMKLTQAKDELDAALAWWRKLNDARQDVLANMAYNMGLTRLRGFKKALFAMQVENWPIASAEMLDSEWAQEVGHRADRLARQMHDGVRIPA